MEREGCNPSGKALGPPGATFCQRPHSACGELGGAGSVLSTAFLNDGKESHHRSCVTWKVSHWEKSLAQAACLFLTLFQFGFELLFY